MNNSIFLITNRGAFPIIFTRIGMVILGSLLITLYIMAFQDSPPSLRYNPYFLAMGTFFIITGTVGLSKKSKFSPKVSLNNDFIQIKEGLWKASKKYNWDEVEEIILGSYQITIRTKNETQKFNIDSTPQISIEIKQAIRKMGEQNNIPVIGG